MSKPRKNRPEHPEVTARSLQETVQAAKSLESIPDQELLENPALNPATRARYDELTAERLQEELDLAHRRKLRAAQEGDRKEGERAETDRAIAAARRATSPAKAITDMTRHQQRFGRIVLAASLLLSVGSAMGLEALVQDVNGPTGVGYLAEIGLTGLSTTVIIWAGILARSGTTISKTTMKLFAFLIAGPLLVSIVGSSLGSGPVGAACSIGSALFAGLAYLITTTSAEAIGQALVKIDHHEQPRRAPVATPGSTRPQTPAAPGNTPSSEAGIGEAASAWLAQQTRPTDQGVATPDSGIDHPLAEEPGNGGEQELYPELDGNRHAVMLAIHTHGVDVSNRALAELTGLARGTVRTHRTALAKDGYEVFDPSKVDEA